MKFWEPTQRVLQGDPPLVRRPKLTEALLKKPPFRFLHDVISEGVHKFHHLFILETFGELGDTIRRMNHLCRQTGFAQGLFTPEELISTNIKEKESKVAYLWKIIDCVGVTLNTNVPVRPLKIVAGLEPEQTNVFLQMLAAATMVDKQRRELAVARVLAGEKQPPCSHSGLEWIQIINDAMSAQDAAQASEQLPKSVEADQQATQATNKEVFSPHSPPDVNTETGLTATEIKDVHQAPKMTNLRLNSEQEQLEEQLLRTALESKPSHNDAELPNALISSKSPECDFFPTSHTPRAIRNLPTELTPAQRINSKDSTPTWSHQSQPESGLNREIASEPSKATGLTETPLYAATSIAENSKSAIAAPSGHVVRTEDAVAPASAPPPCTTPRLNTPSVFPTTSSISGLRPQSARPQSARKAPPVIRSIFDKVGAKEMQGMLLDRPASARISNKEVPALQPVKKPNILLDNKINDDEQENMPILLPPPNIQETTVLSSVECAGKLVRDILENKADIPEQGEQGEKIDETEETGIILGQIRGTTAKKGDLQSRKEEIWKLREVVQSLCKIVNPLGKSIDHLQEDAEIMKREYNFWIKERETYSVRVEEEKRITEEMLQAESGTVLELDEEIKQQNQRIISLKAQVLRNDETIMKLLRMITNRATR